MSCRLLVEAIILLLKVLLNLLNLLLKVGRFVFRVFDRTCVCRKDQEQRRVVIIGASHSGLMCARWLSWRRDLHVTVVDRKEYFEYTPGILRCFVDASYHKHLVCPVATRGEFLRGDALVEDGALTVDGKPVSFDYLVIASGSSYPGQIKASASDTTIAARSVTLEREAAKLAAAAHVYVFSNFSSYFKLLANFWHTLRGSFSAVSKPNCASKYSFESS